MLRKLSSPLLMLAGLVSFTTVAACTATTATDNAATSQAQALAEAQSSYDTVKQAAEVCFTAFDACNLAPSADLGACRTQLQACLPAAAGPGPHCGGGMGQGGCDGDAAPPPPPDAGPPPPPPHHGGPHDGPPDFCREVPLPPPPELKACHDALDTCVKNGADVKVCVDADRACVKTAFEVAFAKLCAQKDAVCSNASAPADACARITAACAQGIAPPVVAP